MLRQSFDPFLEQDALDIVHPDCTKVGGLTEALPVGKWIEFYRPSEVMDAIAGRPFVIDNDGMMAVPKGLGLGIELNREGISRLSAGG